MQDVETARRNRIIWHYIEEARKPPPPPPPGLITISPLTAATNGVFVIDSIDTVSTNTLYVSPTRRRHPETGQLYDAQEPSGDRTIQPEALRKRRLKAKAARKARRKSRR